MEMGSHISAGSFRTTASLRAVKTLMPCLAEGGRWLGTRQHDVAVEDEAAGYAADAHRPAKPGQRIHRLGVVVATQIGADRRVVLVAGSGDTPQYGRVTDVFSVKK